MKKQTANEAQALTVNETQSQVTNYMDTIRENVGHRCKVVPFNTAEWVDGHIAGVQTDARTGKILYIIKTDDGRRLVKMVDSKLLKIATETVEVKPKREARTEWTEEELHALIMTQSSKIGLPVTFTSGEQTREGRIVGLTPDRRTSTLLLKIKCADGTIAHKVHDSKDVDYQHPDDEAEAVHAAWNKRNTFAYNPDARKEWLEAKIAALTSQLEAYTKELDAINAKGAEAAEGAEA